MSKLHPNVEQCHISLLTIVLCFYIVLRNTGHNDSESECANTCKNNEILLGTIHKKSAYRNLFLGFFSLGNGYFHCVMRPTSPDMKVR